MWRGAAWWGALRDRRLAWTLVELGSGYRKDGRYHRAVEVLDRAVQVAETLAVAERRVLSAALTERAITAKELGEYDRAADLYAWVQMIQWNVGATLEDAATLERHLSDLDHCRGCYLSAELHARRAAAWSGRTGIRTGPVLGQPKTWIQEPSA